VRDELRDLPGDHFWLILGNKCHRAEDSPPWERRTRSSSRRVRATWLAWRPDLSHAPGAFQANPIAALADFTGVAAGVTLLPAGSTAATIDYTVKFLTEARGTALTARARVVRPGNTLTVSAVDLYTTGHDGKDGLSATALVTMRNITARH